MKPCLVDLNDFLKKTESFEPVIKEIKTVKKRDDKLNLISIINMTAVIALLIGILFLVKRREEKEEKRKDIEKKLEKLKNIIENNN